MIVRLLDTPENREKLDLILSSLAEAGSRILDDYKDEQLTLVIDFLRAGHEVMKTETAKMREVAV